MLSRCVLGFTAAVAGLCLLGCRTAPIKASRTIAVTIEAEAKTRTIEVKPLTQLDVTLPPVDAGFVWQISFHDARFLKQVQPLQPGTPGVGATVSFISVNFGRTRVRFLLLPKSEGREATPIDQQEIVIAIQH